MNPTEVRTNPSGFTLIELTVAAGLMTIIMVMLYTIFGTASRIYSGADARIEIYQTARAIVDTMQRDLQGCVVDSNGNIFRGWNRAYTWPAWYSTVDLPSLASIRSALLDSYYWPSLPGGYLSQVSYGHVPYWHREQPVWVPDMVWFRTTTEASNYGTPTEVIYRLSYRSGFSFILEKGISRTLTDGDINPNPAVYLSRFEFNPIGFHVREFQLRYYRADIVNADMDIRVGPGNSYLYTEYGASAYYPDYLDGSSHWYDYWPPQDYVYGNANPYFIFDTYAARRARIPAAVQVTLRIGDSGERVFTDYYSTNICDGRDEPLPEGNFRGFSQTTASPPLDGMKQANTAADEVGIVFRQVIFIPTYINALGPRRGDM